MADIRIRLLSQAQMQGFNDAVKGLKAVENEYGKAVTNTIGNTTKMKKVYAQILNSGKENAQELATDFFQNWSKAMIYNFSGGDAAKLRSQLEKAVSEIVNVGGTGAFSDQQKQELQKALTEMGGFYNELADTAETSSRRKEAAYRAELEVLDVIDDKQGIYTLTVEHCKDRMMELARQGKSNTEEFQKLKVELEENAASLNKLNAASSARSSFFKMTLDFGLKSIVTGAVSKALRGITETLKDSSKAAAEAEQIYNKLSTVFDSMADSARRAASEIASSMGVANSTASSALTTVGDLLQAQGMGVAESLETASEWVKQFYDIINFKDINMSLDEFASTFMAGAAGNTRNFRTFGSIVKDSAVKAELAKQGLDKLTGSQLELAKMTIRANLALEQQKNSAGATKREWETQLSVNRRLNEAWKEYRENLGTSINEVLKPMKSWWTDILTEINKANRAQKELQNGAKSMDVYDIYTNKKDAKTFTNTLNQIQASYSTGLKYANNPNFGNVAEDTFSQNAIQSLKDTMIMFTATVEDVRKVMGDALTDAIYAELEAWEKKNKADIEYEKAVTERTSSLEKAKTEYDDFTESLLGITGVSFNAEDASGLMHNTYSDSATQYVIDTILGWTANNIHAALESLDSIDTDEKLAEVFGDVITGALDELDKGGLLESKIASYRQLFEAAWNEFSLDGVIDDAEKAKLEEIKKSYIAATAELENYNAALTAQTDALKSLASVYESSASNIADRAGIQAFMTANPNMSESEASLRWQWQTARNKAISDFSVADADNDGLIEVNGELLKLSDILKIIAQDYQEQIDLLEAENEAQRKGLADDALKSMQGVTGDYLKQISQFGMTDNAKALDDLKRSYEDQIATLKLTDEEAKALKTEYDNQVTALTELQKKQDDYNASLEQEARLKQLTDVTKGYMNDVAQFNMTDDQKALDNLRIAFEEITDGMEKSSAEYLELETEYKNQVEWLTKLQKLQAEYNEQLKVQSALDTLKDATGGLEKQIAQFDMTDEQKRRDDLSRSFSEALESAGVSEKMYVDAQKKLNEQRNHLSEEERNELNKIISTYELLEDEYVSQADLLTTLLGLERQRTDEQKAQAIIDSFSGNAYDKELATIGMDANAKALKELELSYESQLAALKEVNGDTNKLTKNYNAQRKALELLQGKTLIQSHLDSAASYQEQLKYLGMDNVEATRTKLNDQAVAAWTSGNKELYESVWKEIEAFNALQDATEALEKAEREKEEADRKAEAVAAGYSALKDNALGSMGTVGSAISTFTDGEGDIWSDILNVLLDIFQQSEYWDEVVEMFDNLIAPLLPLVNMIAYTLENLEPVFSFIAKLIGGISLVLASILGAVNYVIDFFKWGWDWLKTAFHNIGEVIAHPLNASKRNTEPLPKLADYTRQTTEELNKTYDEILSSLEGIEMNTRKVDTSAYEEMAAAGMITASEYDALMAKAYGSKYDRLTSYNGTSWQNGAGGTTVVYTGDFKFTIDGTNLSADEIAQAVIEYQQNLARTGHYASA